MSTLTVSPPSTLSWKRRLGFYLPGALFAVGLAAIMGLMIPVLVQLFTIWFEDPASNIHMVHGVNDAVLMWIPIVAVVITLVKPDRAIAGIQTAIITFVIMIATTLIAGFPFPPLFIFLALLVVTAAFHPARAELFRFRRPNLAQLGLAAVALVPVLFYVVRHIALQQTAVDEHAEFGHYVTVGTGTLVIVALAFLAAFRPRGARIPAYAAVIGASLFGLASILWPDHASSVGSTLGLVAIVWAGLYLVATEVGGRLFARHENA